MGEKPVPGIPMQRLVARTAAAAGCFAARLAGALLHRTMARVSGEGKREAFAIKPDTVAPVAKGSVVAWLTSSQRPTTTIAVVKILNSYRFALIY